MGNVFAAYSVVIQDFGMLTLTISYGVIEFCFGSKIYIGHRSLAI